MEKRPNEVPETIKSFAKDKVLYTIKCAEDGSCVRIYFTDGTFISIVSTWASWEGAKVMFDIGSW